MASGHGPRTVDAVQTSCDIVDALKELNGAGISELARYLDLSKGTVHSHISTLKQNEYVIKDGDEYRLSLRFLDLSEHVLARMNIQGVVKEGLRELAEDTGEIAQFAVEEHDRAVYVRKVRGEKAVQTASHIGTREYLHCISLGKVLLAHMPRSRVEQVIERHGLPKKTENTITDPDALFQELEVVREQGHAFDDEENIHGLRCVAAPALDGNGNIIGTVSVSGPASRLTGEKFRTELPEKVKRTSNIIEINLQYS